jgi:hypothetical protein
LFEATARITHARPPWPEGIVKVDPYAFDGARILARYSCTRTAKDIDAFISRFTTLFELPDVSKAGEREPLRAKDELRS